MKDTIKLKSASNQYLESQFCPKKHGLGVETVKILSRLFDNLGFFIKLHETSKYVLTPLYLGLGLSLAIVS